MPVGTPGSSSACGWLTDAIPPTSDSSFRTPAPRWTSSCGPCARIATITPMYGAVGHLKWRTSRTAAGDGLFGGAPVPRSDRSRRLPTEAGLVLEFLSSCRSRTGSRHHRGPVPARHVPGAPGAWRRGDTDRHGRVRVRSSGDGVRSGTEAPPLTISHNTLGCARLDQATDARGRSVHRAPFGAGRRVTRYDHYRRLSVVQRLGARYHDRAAGPGARHRADPGRGRHPARLCRPRERGDAAQPLSGWRRGTRV